MHVPSSYAHTRILPGLEDGDPPGRLKNRELPATQCCLRPPPARSGGVCYKAWLLPDLCVSPCSTQPS